MGLRAGLDRCGKYRPPGFDPRNVQLELNLIGRVKFTLEHATKPQRGGGRGLALLFL